MRQIIRYAGPDRETLVLVSFDLVNLFASASIDKAYARIIRSDHGYV